MSETGHVRVIVVLDKTRGRVHSITSSDSDAQQHVRELAATHGGDPNAATMTVGTVVSPHLAAEVTRLRNVIEGIRVITDGIRPDAALAAPEVRLTLIRQVLGAAPAYHKTQETDGEPK